MKLTWEQFIAKKFEIYVPRKQHRHQKKKQMFFKNLVKRRKKKGYAVGRKYIHCKNRGLI
jgi:hypothetical protein